MSGLSPARLAAYRIVLHVERNESYAHETLNKIFKTEKLDERDKAFATRLAYGVIAYKGTLEELIARFSNQSKKTKPEISCALQISLYEIFFEGQKDFVAVNQGVELVKEVAPYAKGFANALLRRAVREEHQFPWGDPKKNSDALARLVGLPQWLIDTLIGQYGIEKTTEIAQALNEPSQLFGAVPPWVSTLDEAQKRFAREDVVMHPFDEALPFAVEFDEPSDALKTTLIAKRHVLVVDAAAQLTVALVGAQSGQDILEIGAGRGTKSLLVAASARAKGAPLNLLAAIDIHTFKSELLAKETKRLALNEIQTLTADASSFDALKNVLPENALFDTVLIDAPCTGIGTLRRHVDKRWRLKPNDSAQLAQLNKKLLCANADFVKPGGKIIYATCTIINEENQKVLEDFLNSEIGSSFEIEPIKSSLVPRNWEKFISQEGTFQSLPETSGPDGHFIAVLRRK